MGKPKGQKVGFGQLSKGGCQERETNRSSDKFDSRTSEQNIVVVLLVSAHTTPRRVYPTCVFVFFGAGGISIALHKLDDHVGDSVITMLREPQLPPMVTILWMDEILHHLSNHEAPLFVSLCRGVNTPGFLR